MKRYVIYGSQVTSLEGFAEHFSAQVLHGHKWSGSLDALHDILRGGFGTPEEGFEIVWLDSHLSREALGHMETARQLTRRLDKCHTSNVAQVYAQLQAAKAGSGPTVFDWLVAAIREHGPNGQESGNNVHLLLL
jgi:RNAse (barnase) inhibitor barstar